MKAQSRCILVAASTMQVLRHLPLTLEVFTVHDSRLGFVELVAEGATMSVVVAVIVEWSDGCFFSFSFADAFNLPSSSFGSVRVEHNGVGCEDVTIADDGHCGVDGVADGHSGVGSDDATTAEVFCDDDANNSNDEDDGHCGVVDTSGLTTA